MSDITKQVVIVGKMFRGLCGEGMVGFRDPKRSMFLMRLEEKKKNIDWDLRLCLKKAEEFHCTDQPHQRVGLSGVVILAGTLRFS